MWADNHFLWKIIYNTSEHYSDDRFCHYYIIAQELNKQDNIEKKMLK